MSVGKQWGMCGYVSCCVMYPPRCMFRFSFCGQCWWLCFACKVYVNVWLLGIICVEMYCVLCEVIWRTVYNALIVISIVCVGSAVVRYCMVMTSLLVTVHGKFGWWRVMVDISSYREWVYIVYVNVSETMVPVISRVGGYQCENVSHENDPVLVRLLSIVWTGISAGSSVLVECACNFCKCCVSVNVRERNFVWCRGI